MFNVSRQDTVDTLLKNAAQCGATDLMTFAIKENAEEHKNHDYALVSCIEQNNREGFDILINNDGIISDSAFNSNALYQDYWSGKDMSVANQTYFMTQMIERSQPSTYNPRNSRSQCISMILGNGRKDLLDIIAKKVNVQQFVEKEKLSLLISNAIYKTEPTDAIRETVAAFVEYFRPLSLKNDDPENPNAGEDRFVRALYQLGMTDYLKALHEAKEVDMYRKQVLESAESVESFFDNLTENPNLRLSCHALKDLIEKERPEPINQDDLKNLILHTQQDLSYGSYSFERILENLAHKNDIDSIKTVIESAALLKGTVEESDYGMIFSAFKSIAQTPKAMRFINNMLADDTHRKVLNEKWADNEDSSYFSGSNAGQWLISAINDKERFESLLDLLPVTENSLRYFVENANRNRYEADENFLSIIHKKPYLIHSVLNCSTISDKIKEEFKTSVRYHFQYADRTIPSAIKMLTKSASKRKDAFKGELATRIILADKSDLRSALREFYNDTKTVLSVIGLMGLPPLDLINEFSFNSSVQAELLKQTV